MSAVLSVPEFVLSVVSQGDLSSVSAFQFMGHSPVLNILMNAVPLVSGTFCDTGVTERFGFVLILTAQVSVLVSPLLSVMVSLMKTVPVVSPGVGLMKTGRAVSALESVIWGPPVWSHWYERTVPSGSAEAVPSSVTGSPSQAV